MPQRAARRFAMAELRVGTILIAIQSVRDAIADLELLLTSEILKDRAEIEDILFSYERAAADLKAAYNAELEKGPINYPAYEELIKPSSIRLALRGNKNER